MTPSLATRYKVEVFVSGTATCPVATSATTTVYVTPGATNSGTPTCGRPGCHESITIRVFGKQWYTYFGNHGCAAPTATASQSYLG